MNNVVQNRINHNTFQINMRAHQPHLHHPVDHKFAAMLDEVKAEYHKKPSEGPELVPYFFPPMPSSPPQASKLCELPGSEFVPFSDMPDETTFAPTPYVAKVFVGGLRHDATREEIARIVVWITGVPVCRDNVIIFKRGVSQNSGSCVIHLPSAEAAEHFIKFSKHVLYEEGGVRTHLDQPTLLAFSRSLKGSPHPMVIEPAKARDPPQQNMFPMPHMMEYGQGALMPQQTFNPNAAPFQPGGSQRSMLPPQPPQQIGYDMNGNPMYAAPGAMPFIMPAAPMNR